MSIENPRKTAEERDVARRMLVRLKYDIERIAEQLSGIRNSIGMYAEQIVRLQAREQELSEKLEKYKVELDALLKEG